MKNIFFIALFLSFSYTISAQDTLDIYIDSLRIEQVTEEPPVYRIPIRAKGFTNVDAFDFRGSFSSGIKITGIEYLGNINEEVPTFGINGVDSNAFTWLILGAQASITVPFDTLIAYLIVEADLENEIFGFTCEGVEAITGGMENVTIPASCISVAEIRYIPFRTISGAVTTPTGDSLANVIVELRNDEQVVATDTTGSDGTYAFAEVQTTENYTVAVARKTETETRSQRIRGVNIADLVLMARDLVGSDTISDPLGLLAADVSGDGETGLIDLLQIQQYILARTDGYGEQPYYRFYAETEDGLRETIVIDPASAEEVTVNFTIVKMGDVNLSSYR